MSEQVSSHNEIKQLVQQATAMESMLRAQHDILRQRGMALPSGMLEKLYYMRIDLQNLADRLVGEATELDQLRALAGTSQIVNSSLDIDLVLNEVMDTVIALTGAERGYIMLRDAETGELLFKTARDRNRQSLDQSRFTVSSTIVYHVAETGEPVVSQNALLDPRYSTQESIVMHAPRSVLCAPLIYKGKISGVVYADNRQIPDLFGEKELSLLMAFGNQAAIAIENARLFEGARRALIEITEMKELMDNVLQSIASGVITTDIDHHIVTYNQAAERILGVSYDHAVGQPLQTVLPAFAGFDALIASALRGNMPQVVEIEPVLPGRGPVNLSLKIAPLKDASAVIYGMALVVDDLTEIKKRDATLNVVRTYLPPSLVRNIQSIDGLGLSGDEREISVIFADVRGFTTFSEQLPPEELMEVINHYLAVSSEAIQLYDGIIDKYMGDAVVGLFNTQLNPQRDHAIRAVRAALSMAYDVRALHEILPDEQRLFYGIGVDTGTAMLGNVGSPSRKVFTAIGKPFNLAKLMQENALAGEIIISQSTYDLAHHLFEIEVLEPRKVKGNTGFLQLMYRVNGIKRNK
ncbi:MAG TPA: adenylate/guanylate cyclase domain-containing protein [Aggregatilineaceae bacterium]|nr:adenylate/guanylate cyclase domain-containing protein [Aggregatilineaceae bacterium]